MADKPTEKPGTQVSDTPNTEEKTKTKAPTAEELAKLAEENMAEWFDNDRLAKKAEPAPAPEEEAAKDEEKKAELEKPAAVEEEEKPKEEKPVGRKPSLTDFPQADAKEDEAEKPKVEPRGNDLDEEKLDELATRVADKIKPTEKKEEKPVDPYEGFGRKERSQLEALKHLSEIDPRFKGRDLAAETVRFWKAEQDYIAAWEKENKGEKFDPADEAHAAFYRKNEPAGVGDDDIMEARADMKASAKVREAEEKLASQYEKRLEERLAPIEKDRLYREKAPVIKQSIVNSVTELAASIVPDIVGDGGLTEEVEEKIRAEDPVVMELLEAESEVLKVRVHELETMRHMEGHFTFNDKKSVNVGDQRIYPHADIIDTALHLESKLANLPEADQVVDGKRFMSRVEKLKRQEAIMGSNLPEGDKVRRLRALETGFWCIGADDVRAAFVAQASARVRRGLEIADKRAKALEEKNRKKPETKSQPDAQKEQEKRTSKPPSSVAAESDVVDTRIPGTKAGKSEIEKAKADWF